MITPTSETIAKTTTTLEAGLNQIAALGEENGLFHKIVLDLYALSKLTDPDNAAKYKELADAIQVTAEKMNFLVGNLQESLVTPLKESKDNPDVKHDLKAVTEQVADYFYDCEALWRKIDNRAIERKKSHDLTAELSKVVARRASANEDGIKLKSSVPPGNSPNFGVKLRPVQGE